MPAPPALLTFDVLGTILDWRTGLETACAQAGHPLGPGAFDRIVDAQAELERGPFATYEAITRASLTRILGLTDAAAATIAAGLGDWPPYPDIAVLPDLRRMAPCAAMTNSDRHHGAAIQHRLGFHLDAWLCAEEVRAYKPDPVFWHRMAALRDIAPAPHWWHVSAYADYDLATASALGLTTVLVRRPHARPGPATHTVRDLHALRDLLRAT